MTPDDLKRVLCEKAHELGANLVRSCSVRMWETHPMQSPEFWPHAIWPWAKNVIVLGIPLYAPMIRTTPSMVYQDLYDTSNRVLDDIAYRLTNYIVTGLGYRAIFFPRDCYYNIEALEANPNAAFSHVVAGYYAGMGSIGDSHNLLTKEFGPRVRLVSVVTDAPLTPDAMLQKNVCIHCGKCLQSCPSQCFRKNGDAIYDMDKTACARYHIMLKTQRHWPCGVCVSVCPVGEDMKAYRGERMISEDGIRHCQAFGS